MDLTSNFGVPEAMGPIAKRAIGARRFFDHVVDGGRKIVYFLVSNFDRKCRVRHQMVWNPCIRRIRDLVSVDWPSRSTIL